MAPKVYRGDAFLVLRARVQKSALNAFLPEGDEHLAYGALDILEDSPGYPNYHLKYISGGILRYLFSFFEGLTRLEPSKKETG